LRRLRGAALTALLAGAAAVTAGCSVNKQGLEGDPDAGAPRDGNAGLDVPIDQPASDRACAACDVAATFVTLPGGRFTGTTAGTSASAGSCGGGDAPEARFTLDLPVASDLFVTTHGTGFDTVVYLDRGCCGDEVACNDDADGRNTSVLAAPGLAAGTYYITVDGADDNAAGDFTIDIYATPTSSHPAEACGNPVRIAADAVSGNTCGYEDNYSPPLGCSTAVSGNKGLDQVYYFVLDATSTVSFSTCDGTCIDTVLYVRDVCNDNGSQLPCDDDSCRAGESCLPTGNPVQSLVSATLGPGAHYLMLDTFSASPGPCGAFTITPTGVP
jgi:hypothetical protein